MILSDKEPPKMSKYSFSVIHLGWACSLPLQVVYFPSENTLKESEFSFASGY